MSHQFPDRWSNLSVVLSHDWLTGMRGGERVLELLCEGFPSAPLFTLLHATGSVSDTIERHPITTSFLQHIPGIRHNYRYGLPLFPAAVGGMQTPPADLLISTSHCAAKSLKPQTGTRHLCYCFTPMRYAWTFYDEYFGKNPVKALFLKPILASLRRWDRRTANRVDHFVAISEHVRDRIQRFYDRDADVVYPPVDTEFYTPGRVADAGTYDLVVSALVPYKRVDLAVRACTRAGRALKVVGVGTEIARLRNDAGPSVEFLEWQSDEAIRDLYRGCRALIFPGEEDFGIVPVEAQACGRPAVAFRRGGALETVKEGVSGVFFDQQTEESLVKALEQADAHTWDEAAIQENAGQFSIQRFLDGLDKSIMRVLEE